jgi:hypothetical protein
MPQKAEAFLANSLIYKKMGHLLINTLACRAKKSSPCEGLRESG